MTWSIASRVLVFLLAVLAALAPTEARAQAAGGACTGAGIAAQQANGNNLYCNSSVWTYPAYQFGVATVSSGSCSSTTAGEVQWTGSALEYCNGSSWATIAGGVTGSGTTNYLARWTPNGTTLGIGATYDNGTNVGVGTTSIYSKMEIDNSSNSTAYLGAWGEIPLVLRNTDNTANDWNLLDFMDSATHMGAVGVQVTNHSTPTADLTFGTVNTSMSEKMRITSAGNVGIGTTAPLSILDVRKTTTGGTTDFDFYNTEATSTTLGQSARLRLAPWSGFIGTNLAPYIEGLIDTSGEAGLAFGTYPGGAAVERMRITYNGNVGIGTTVPQSTLSVSGGVAVGTTYAGTNAASSNNLVVQGEVGIGTPSPTTPLTIATGLTANGLSFAYNAGMAYQNMIANNFSGSQPGQYMAFTLQGGWGGPVTALTLNGVGNVTVGSQLYAPSATIGPENATPISSLELTNANLNGTYLTMNYDGGNFYNSISNSFSGGTLRSNFMQFNVTNLTPAQVNVLTLYGDASASFAGNVGIGSSIPAAKLDVTGVINANNGVTSNGSFLQGWLNATNYVQFPNATSGSPSYYMGWATNITSRQLFINNLDADNNPADPGGSIVFQTGTTPSPRMTIDYYGNVGIGLTTPYQQLAISASTAPAIGFAQTTGGYTFSNATTGGLAAIVAENVAPSGAPWSGSAIIFQTHSGNAPALTNDMIINAGNVGIGTTVPNGPLQVRYGSNQNLRVYGLEDLLSGVSLDSINDANNALEGMEIRGNPIGLNPGGGNVGIGSTAPGAPLDVYYSTSGTTPTVAKLDANVNAVGSGPFLDFNLNWTNTYPNWVGGRIGSVYETTSTGADNAALVFYTNTNNNATLGDAGTTEKMRILGNGNVGIGTTGPAYLLHVGSASASGTVAEFQNSSGNCTFTPTTSTWSCSSDARLKKDIVDTGDALPWLGDMRIRDFTLKATGERKTGVVAQEMLPAHPGMVHVGKDGFYTVDDPNPWKLVKAMQELKADNDNLHRRDEELKADNDSLKAANDNEAAQIKGLTARLDALEAARH